MTNKPIYIKIYDKIKSAIKGGTYPPGSFLPTEQELETLYQVSRTTIRKAVKLLSDEGILSVRQGCGTMVMDTRTTQNYNQVTSLPEKDWLRLLETGYDGQIYESKAAESEELPDTFSIENAYFASPESLLVFLEDLIRGKYGNIFRAKGQLPAGSCWFQFDVADSRYGITGCEPQKAGKSVFIGTDIHRQAIRRTVLSKMIQKKIHAKKRGHLTFICCNCFLSLLMLN